MAKVSLSLEKALFILTPFKYCMNTKNLKIRNYGVCCLVAVWRQICMTKYRMQPRQSLKGTYVFITVECPAGTYQSEIQCRPCMKGYHQPRRGQTRCWRCPPRSHSYKEGARVCVIIRSDGTV